MPDSKGKIITITAITVILLAAGGIAVYWFGFSERGKKVSDEVPPVVADLDSSKIRVKLKDGFISDDKKLIVNLTLSGLPDKKLVEELQKNGNFSVEVDGKKAEILSSEFSGENSLAIRASAKIGDEKFKNFNEGETQNLNIRTDFSYGKSDTISKSLTTTFQKSGKTSSQGQEVAFGKITESDKQTTSPQDRITRGPNAPKPVPGNLKKPDETKSGEKQTRAEQPRTGSNSDSAAKPTFGQPKTSESQ